MNSSYMDVVIGLILVFVVFSLACTILTEWWARIWDERASRLKAFIKKLLSNESCAFIQHSLIAKLRTNGKFPSYIPPKAFALAVIDLTFTITPEGQLNLNPNLPTDLEQLLRALSNGTRNSFAHTQERLERWYTEAMERLSGQYTRYAHTRALVIAAIVAIGLNVDTIRITRELIRHPVKAAAAVTIASKVNVDPADPAKAMNTLAPEFGKLGLPIGWSQTCEQPCEDQTPAWYAPSRLLGWLLTIAALSLGAPFWFDTLNRVMRLRQTGGKPASP